MPILIVKWTMGIFQTLKVIWIIVIYVDNWYANLIVIHVIGICHPNSHIDNCIQLVLKAQLKVYNYHNIKYLVATNCPTFLTVLFSSYLLPLSLPCPSPHSSPWLHKVSPSLNSISPTSISGKANLTTDAILATTAGHPPVTGGRQEHGRYQMTRHLLIL